jgi:hypothetical protein
MPFKNLNDHREQLRAADRRWYAKHREEKLAKMKQFRKDNPELMYEQGHRFNERHKEKRNAESREYRRTHLEQFKEYDRIHYAKKPNCYRTWKAMRTRCYNPNVVGYKYYGAKGIKVCERWDSFDNFLEDMGERPFGWDLHRIDHDKDYSKDNCVWLPKSEHTRITKRASHKPGGPYDPPTLGF